MIPQWQQDIINSKNKEFVYAIEWLDKNENVLDDVIVDVVDGNINFDGTKSNRRSANITLKNLDKKYIPNAKNFLWINNKIKFRSGYRYGDNQTLFFNQGIYLISDPSILSHPTRKEITLDLLDKWCLLDGTISGKLMNKTIIDVGTRIDVAVKNLIELSGETKYIIDDCNIVLPYTIEKESSETIASVLEEICLICSYECFYDNNGYFRFRKALMSEDYISTPSSWKYTTSGLYLESKRDLKWSSVRNSIKVIGDTDDTGVTFIGIAKDESSDMSIDNIEERNELIEDSNIFSNELAQDRADWELQQRIMVSETLNSSIIPNFSHVTGDIIENEDDNNGASGNYVIQSISYPISYNPIMSIGVWAIRDWRNG